MINFLKTCWLCLRQVSPPVKRAITNFFSPPPAPEIEWSTPIPLHEDGAVRARQAEALLADPILQGAFAKVKATCHSDWERADSGDTQTQQLAHLRLQTVKALEGAIRAHIVAAKKTEYDKSLIKRK